MTSQVKHDDALYKLLTDYVISQEIEKDTYDNRVLESVSAANAEVERLKLLKETDDISGVENADAYEETKGEDVSGGVTIEPLMYPDAYEGSKEEKVPDVVRSPWNQNVSVAQEGQKFSVVSVVPDPKSSDVAIKIFEAYDTIEEAKQAACSVQSDFPMFNVTVVDMYNWLVLPPELSRIENTFFLEDGLNNLVHTHTKEGKKAQMAKGLC